MKILIEIVVLLSLFGIVAQDFIERRVYLVLFLISGITITMLHFSNVNNMQFLLAIFINLSIVFLIILILFLYAQLVLKKVFSTTFGLGDFLFFLVLALGFQTTTFLVLFSFSLLFSLTLYLVLKSRLKRKTVPLAGFQALFISLMFIANWTFDFINLYTF